MTEVFGRKYSLIFGIPKSVGVFVNTLYADYVDTPLAPADNLPGTINMQLREAWYKEFNDLQIRAVLPQTKTNTASNSDKAYIEVYNLTKETREYLQRARILILKAGYVQDSVLPEVFVGEIQTISNEKKGKDNVTTILCGQNIRLGKDVRVKKTYQAGTSFYSILKDLSLIAGQNGIDIGNATLPPPIQPYEDLNAENRFLIRPLPVEGYILDVIDQVVSMIDYRSYMILNRLYIEPIVGGNPKFLPIVEVDESDLQGSIRVTKQTKFDGSNATDSKEITVQLFLNGDISSSKILRIKQGDYRGDYEISNTTHLLDYEGTDWTTEVVARGIQ